MYDIIVIGARAAGSPTAMLLAKKGYRVLLLDRATFPSDTLSTHQIQIRGSLPLKRWGLLEPVLATDCPPVSELLFDMEPFSMQGKYPPCGGVEAVICPRRTILDKILVDAAVKAGAELREDFLVEELLFEGERVTGVRGRMKSGGGESYPSVTEQARLVVGADGKHSLVARQVKAQQYHSKPALTCAYYTYWEGLQLERGELYGMSQSVAGFWLTNAGLAIIYTGYPIVEFQGIRRDIEGKFWQTMNLIPGMVERLRSGRQAERFYGTADLPTFYRRPYGHGWVLVGDAGLAMDPITGQGIGNAFQDAERMADALDKVFSGRESWETAMQRYTQARDWETLPMYEFTSQIASFAPPSIEQQVLFAALERKPEAASRFFGALTGSVSLREFLSLPSLYRILGIFGIGRVLFRKLIPS